MKSTIWQHFHWRLATGAVDTKKMAAFNLQGTWMRALAAGIALVTTAALAQPAGEIPLRVTSHREFPAASQVVAGAVLPAHGLRVTLAVMSATGWRAEEVLEAAKRAAGILAQCAIRTSIELHEFEGPKRYRSLFTPASRELAGRLALPKPTVFFVADTLNRPAFDAEAIGRGNSRTRPEMADTVWIASGARDLPVVIAHELAHVLSDSGEHSKEAGNLMRQESARDSTRLTTDQCGSIVRTGAANELLQPLAPTRLPGAASDVGRIQ